MVNDIKVKLMIVCATLMMCVLTGVNVRGDTKYVNGYLYGNHSWVATNTYILDGFVYIMSNAVVNIEAGTIVRGDTGSGTSGGAATGFGDMNYSAAYNQHNNDIKSSTVNNRPNQGGTQIFNQQMNLTTIKSDSDRFAGRVNPAISVTPMPPSVQTYGSITMPQYYNECAGCDRIQPDILNAFRSNPYTHSLTTSV